MVEILIAMVIFGLIMSAVMYQLHQGVQLQERQLESNQGVDGLQRAFYWIQQDILQFYPRTVLSEYGEKLPVFIKDNEAISWSRLGMGLSQQLSKQSEFLRVSYALKDGVLVRSYWFTMDRAADTQPEQMLLLDDIESLEWIFWYNQNSIVLSSSEWPIARTEIQDSELSWPDLIEIKLKHKQFGEIVRRFPLIPAVAGDK